jgi:hypothetical protein
VTAIRRELAGFVWSPDPAVGGNTVTRLYDAETAAYNDVTTVSEKVAQQVRKIAATSSAVERHGAPTG